jgi:Protein of unknown function (DUF1573)
VVQTHFAFTNIGALELEIDLVSTCDCIVAEWEDSTIAPGKTSYIVVQFSSEKEDYGRFRKSVDLIFKNTDEEGYPLVKQVYLVGEVE